MKLILTQEVTGLGAPGDIVEVKDGYGRNYLVPRGLAIRWTRGAEKQIVDDQAGARGPRGPRRRPRPGDQGPAREADRSRSPARAGDGGRLFGSVTVADVVDAVKAAGGPDIDKRRDRAARADQDRRRRTAVTVRLHPDVAATIALDVVPPDRLAAPDRSADRRPRRGERTSICWTPARHLPDFLGCTPWGRHRRRSAA